jgi:hypothetical protein
VAAVRTDDLGDYRLHTLSPGFYYLSAGGQLAGPEAMAPGLRERVFGGGYSSPNRIPQFSTTMFYPGAPDEASASAIDLQSGAELRGVDFYVSLPRPFRIRGRVVDTRTGKPPQRASFALTLQDSGSRGGVNLIENINPQYNPEDGSFVLQNINGRPYYLTAMIPDAQPQRLPAPGTMSADELTKFFIAREAAELARPKTSLALNVNGDIDGVVLAITSGGSLKGRVTGGPSLDKVRIQLRHQFGDVNGVVAADGTLRLDNVRPADWRVSITGLPAGFYVREARLGDKDVLNTPLHYTEGEASELTIVLSPTAGTIEGTASPAAQVVLIPAQNRERTELFKGVMADVAGRFSISSIAPGDYTLASFETLEPYAYFDPIVIREAEKRGTAVPVNESSKQVVNVTAEERRTP